MKTFKILRIMYNKELNGQNSVATSAQKNNKVMWTYGNENDCTFFKTKKEAKEHRQANFGHLYTEKELIKLLPIYKLVKVNEIVENEITTIDIITPEMIENALCQSMNFTYSKEKGNEIVLEDLNGNKTDMKVWVEKTITDKGLNYKFRLEGTFNGEKVHCDIDSNSSQWCDYELFNGELIKTISEMFWFEIDDAFLGLRNIVGVY